MSLGMDYAEGNSRNYYIFLDYGLNTGHRMNITADQSYFEYDSGQYQTQSFGIGASNDTLDIVNVGFNLQQWGDPEHIIVNSASGQLAVNTENFQISVQPQLRAIELITNNLAIKQIETNGFGWNFTAEYHGLDNWAAHISYGQNQYSRDLSLFQSSPQAYVRIAKARIFGVDFSSQHVGLGVDYFGEENSASLNFQQSQSAVDNYITQYWSISFSRSLLPQVYISLQTGLQNTDDQTTWNGGGNLSVSW